MAELLLDTTVLIDALRGHKTAAQLRKLRSEGPPPYVCAINVEEIWRGARPGEEDAVARLLGALRLAPLRRAEGEQAGRWRSSFAQRGRTLSQADCLIAAAAKGVGARLATGNPRDFPMDGLDIEHWPVG
ncbi:MAG TPA: PIN domain-containing protein [Solirubrobacterales bacterium]